MKIMKMWRNTTLFAYFRFMGYVMMIVGIYLIVNGIGDYAGQSRQKDWIPIEATVTDVSSEVVSSSPGRHGSNSSTYYIMAYEYAVDGETYTGRTGRMSSPRSAGREYGDSLSQYPQSAGPFDFGNGHRSGGLFPLWGAGATSQPSAKDAHRGAEEIGSGDRHGI